MLGIIKRNKEIIKKLLIILFIIILLEVFLFNITSFKTLFGKYEVKVYKEPSFLYYKDNNTRACVMVDNINTKTATIKVDIDNIDEVSEYKVYYSDDITNSYIGGFTKNYIPGEEKTKFIPLNLSGETNGFIIELDSKIFDNGNLKYISVNEKIPFEFNVIRVITIFVISTFIYFMIYSDFFNKEYSPENFKQDLVLLGILAVFLIILSFINTYSENVDEFEFYNKDFVDAIMHGEVALLHEPSENFKNLENPYDTQERESLVRNEDYIWDTAYYNGKEYVYFGILPMLISFLPFYIITKRYLKMCAVLFVFSALCFILFKSILLKIINKFDIKLPFKIVVEFYILLCSGSLILYANGIPRIYELAIISGLYFVLQGIYFILLASESEKRRYLNIFIGSLFLALSVACRPIDLFASLLVLPYLISLLIDNIKIFKDNKKPLLRLILAVAFPYLTVGTMLMWYNYIRFGNVFDFGTKYQLTIINMNGLSNRFSAIPIGLFTNLFSVPDFLSVFPFIGNHNKLSTFYGYYYIENMIGGLFIIAPIVFMNFFMIKANKKTKDKKLKIVINSLVIVGMLICVLSIMMAGSNQRYLIDYSWMLILSALLIFCIIYNSLKANETKRVLQTILCFITIYTALISISAGIVSEKDYMKSYSPEEYYKLRYTISFWE